jgi:hypothetical protein
MEFRKLKASEVQVRPTDTKNKGRATLLLYQDARVFMDILDETVGNENWQKEYYEVKGNVYCRIGIRNQFGEWVWKSDCGSESNVDAEKGEASDSAKRAAVCWGIGRELYQTPKVKINCPDNYYYNDKMTMTFLVKEIEWEGKTLKSLVIIDKFGKEVYNYGEGGKVQEEKPKDERSNLEILKTYCGAMKNQEGIDKDELLKFYNYYEPLMSEWRMKVKPEALWNKWLQSKR